VKAYTLQVVEGVHSETLESYVLLIVKIPELDLTLDLPVPLDTARTLATDMAELADKLAG
jgi:hypothetical protein